MMKPPRAALILAISCAAAGLAQAETQTDWEAEIGILDAQIAEVDATIGEHGEGLTGPLAQSRREALLLMRTVLETRRQAEEGGIEMETVVPVVEPDPERAQRLIGEIVAAQDRISAATEEAAGAAGLVQAVAISRVEIEKLTLAQLQMAWLQAEYGIAFPQFPDPTPADAPQVAPTAAVTAAPDNNDEARVAWADPDHPDVDYTIAPFELAHQEGNEISGWWTLETERAPIDDSLKISAVNHSAHNPRSFMHWTALSLRCHEGEPAVVFVQEEFLTTDFRNRSLDVTYRIDDAPAVQARWSSLTNSMGAGLFGNDAPPFIRAIQDAEQVFIRITDNAGRRSDATFRLAGGERIYEAVAGACGFSLLSLSSDDYRAIQSLLNAGGYDAGTPDGVWGPSSQSALRRFQADTGLQETGAPDRATIEALGIPG